MREEAEVLAQLSSWGRKNEWVRAAVLTSSRANPLRETDWLSDYDVELYVTELAPFRADDAWLRAFGRILVRWPLRPQETDFQEGWITRLVLFEDHVRIDFQITDRKTVPLGAYRDGYRILIDKDGLLAALPPATHDAFQIRRPSQEQYSDRVNAFWWDAAYVPKHLWRDELPFAGQMARELREGKLHPMMEWWIGVRSGWAVNPALAVDGSSDSSIPGRGRRTRQHSPRHSWTTSGGGSSPQSTCSAAWQETSECASGIPIRSKSKRRH